jgi:hypothetical protein
MKQMYSLIEREFVQAPDQGVVHVEARVYRWNYLKVCGILYGTRLGSVSALYRSPSPTTVSPRRWSNAFVDDIDTGGPKYVHMDTSQGDDGMEFVKTLDA